MPGTLGCFIDSLAGFCEQVICFLHSPRADEIDRMDYRIYSKNVILVDIGSHTSIMARTLRAGTYNAFLKDYAKDMDALLVRGPSPLLPSLISHSRLPTALLLVGDYVSGVDDLPQPYWRKEAIRLWSHWNKFGQMRAARRSTTFVNSHVLYQELENKIPSLHEIRTTTLTDNDFFIRTDTCEKLPIHLLYVGRMDRAKGLMQMAQAVALLRRRGENVLLDLVGWPERGDTILEEIRVFAIKENIDEFIHYHGPRPLGSELFSFYRNADIFLIASLSSFEGFPRTIWEAMAHSLPVIATRVGGIPSFIEGKAELIPPRSVEALVDAVQRLLHDSQLRQSYIQAGYGLAKENTLDKQARTIIKQIEMELS